MLRRDIQQYLQPSKFPRIKQTVNGKFADRLIGVGSAKTGVCRSNCKWCDSTGFIIIPSVISPFPTPGPVWAEMSNELEPGMHLTHGVTILLRVLVHSLYVRYLFFAFPQPFEEDVYTKFNIMHRGAPVMLTWPKRAEGNNSIVPKERQRRIIYKFV